MKTQLAEWNSRDADDYNRFYYSQGVLPDEKEALRFEIEFLQRRANHPFNLALEYGCGPTLLRAIAASRYIRSLDMADKFDSNLTCVRNWLNREANCPDWSIFTNYILQCEGIEQPTPRDIQEREDLTRKAISNLLVTDATERYPLGKQRDAVYDLIITGWCLECITNDKEEWQNAMRNVLSLLKVGGSLVMAALHRCRAYQVGDKWFPSCNLEADDLQATFRDNGFSSSTITIQQCPVPIYRQHGWQSILLASATKVV